MSANHFHTIGSLGDATPFVSRILGIIEHINLFEDFSPGEVEKLARYMVAYRVPAGAQIIEEGEPGDFLLLIIEGSIEIVKTGSNGLPARIGLAGPGKTLGEMSVIDGEPRFASCITEQDCLLAVLDRENLSRILADEPRMGVKILMELLMLLNQRLRGVSNDLMRCMSDKQKRIGMVR
ncbi:MAG: cyclic nucleotide-binding domain-containing protein [Rhodocyclaceae bacterium]|nr:MAG: cyclic nucleotide-binding domain-containing protein [Rhodocyclaceae bacterium]